MLDKQLCAILGIDEYTQWLVNEMDNIEDELEQTGRNELRYEKLRAKHSALKEARDAYISFKKKLNQGEK